LSDEVWHGYLSGANDLHVVQLMPLPPNRLFIEIQIGLLFWCWLTQVVLEKEAVKRMFYLLSVT